MYKVYAGDICIYDDRSQSSRTTLVSPKLSLADNSAGTFTFTIPPTNVGYDRIVRMSTEIRVIRDTDEIWSGRAISEDEDYWKQKTYTCEGELAYLNDILQPQAAYRDYTIRQFLTAIIDNYNSRASANRQFTIGAVTVDSYNAYSSSGLVPATITTTTDYSSTLEVLKKTLLDVYEGHLYVRKVSGIRYLDYIADSPRTNSQKIDFGENLMDFTRNWDDTELCTVIYPRGATFEDVEKEYGLVYTISKSKEPQYARFNIQFHFTFKNPGVPADYRVYKENGDYDFGRYTYTVYFQYRDLTSGDTDWATFFSEDWTMEAGSKSNKSYDEDFWCDPAHKYEWRAWLIERREGYDYDYHYSGPDCKGSDYDTGFHNYELNFTDGALDGSEKRITVKNVNNGSEVVQNNNAVATYGVIQRVVTWDKIEDPQKLLNLAQWYLTDYQFNNMMLEVSALDLHYYNSSEWSIKLLDRIRVVSKPHGLDKMFVVSKLEIPLDQPENTTFTMGTKPRNSFTQSSNNTKNDVYSQIGQIPSAGDIANQMASSGYQLLQSAKENARQIIESHTNGFITITTNANGTNELYISELQDLNASEKYWRWNMGGLSYTPDGGQTYSLAMTMNGEIVANMITTGQMLADRVRLYGLMGVYNQSTGTTPGGYIGYGKGLIGGSVWGNSDTYTDGIMISNTCNTDTNGSLTPNPRYFICTTAGVRMNADAQSFYLTDGNNGSNGALIISNTFTFRASALHVYPPVNANDGPSDIAQTGTINFGDGWLLVNKGLVVGYSESSNISGYFTGSDSSNTVVNGSSTLKGKVSGNTRFSASSSEAYMQYDSDTLFKVTSSETRMQVTGQAYANVTTSGFKAQLHDSRYIVVNTYYCRMQASDSTYIQADTNQILLRYSRDNRIEIDDDGINLWAGSYQAWVSVNSPGFGSTSDRRVKHDISYNIDGDLIDKLKPATFKFNGTDKTRYGFIAQDVAEVIPDIVSHSPKDKDLLGLNYDDFIAVLTAKVQSQTKIIKAQEERIDELEKRLARLEAMIFGDKEVI